MDIDWFTFLAQIVNFLVLVALLRWVLYDRIIQAMNAREERFAKRLEDADQRQADADAKAEQYQQRLAEIDLEREAQINESRREARAEYERLVREARGEVERRRNQWSEAWKREREDLLFALREQAGSAGTEVARRTLQQLADTDLEERMCHAFDERIRRLDQQQRDEISRHLMDGSTPITVRSAFELPEQRREQIRKTVRETFCSKEEVRFETSGDLICGLELDVGGFSFGWNAKEMLDDIKLEFDQQLKSLKA
jgi:F-type H+-transporting ATPase subunit b